MNIPTQFAGRFTVVEEIAKRQYSAIYKATDSELGGHQVAVKVFFDRPGNNEAWKQRYAEEVGHFRAASSRFLLPIVAGGCEDDWFYLVMEYVEGTSLREKLKSAPGPMPIEKAVALASDIAEGLKDLHDNGVYHGHLDSRAVLFKGGEVRIAGYCPGVITEMQKGKSTVGGFTIDPVYVSPEQVSGGVIDHRADIFALAVMTFEMVTGERPFVGSNPMQTAMMRLSNKPPAPAKINTAVSPLLDAAVMKGLAGDPKLRYSSVQAFQEAITGGKKAPVNPLSGLEGQPEQVGTQTIGVSMSTESIREMLDRHDSVKEKNKQPDISSVPSSGVAATMMGAPVYAAGVTAVGGAASSGLVQAASLIVTKGAERGKRYELSRDQMILGSDASCDVCVKDRTLPARYAIIVRRGALYHVGALGAGGLLLNGQEAAASGDVPLKRGDTLAAGESELRFVEPGEVFTLDAEAADRAIDRAPSKIPRILGMAIVIIGVLAVGGFFAYQSTISDQAEVRRKQSLRDEQDRKRLIGELRAEGDRLFKLGQLVEPAGENSRKCFEEIVALDPDDSYAKRRLAEIDERLRASRDQQDRNRQLEQKIEKLLGEADRFFAEAKYVSPPGNNARDTYQSVLRLDPANEKAKTRIAEIDKLLGDMVGKISAYLAQAREFQKKGQFVSPAGENAFELISQVQKIDPKNEEAKKLLYEMSAQSIVIGDRAKEAADLTKMKKAYLTAQALGVDPAYVKVRLRGTDLIKKSSSSVIFVDRKDREKQAAGAGGQFLDTAELERNIAAVKLSGGLGATEGGRKFIDVQSLGE